MINIVCTVIGTGIIVATATGAVLSGFYKTNKDATKDHENILTIVRKEIKETEAKLQREILEHTHSFKADLEKISEKIDNMRNYYVSNENFKTYADAMNQLLKMSTERMTRIEDGIDDIRNEVSALVRNSRKYSE